MRVAEQPWGPWSNARIIFDSRDGHGQFIHAPGRDQVYDAMFGCSRADEWGWAYGQYQIAPYATGVKDRYTKIYFTLSTWNPYQVMQISAVIPRAGQELDPQAYAYDITAPNSQKFARVSVLQAQLAATRQLSWELPRQASQCSADYIEWAQFQAIEDLRAELKNKFRQLITRISTPEDQAEVYATITIDLVTLGAKDSQDSLDHNVYKMWALQAIQNGHSEWLVSEVNRRMDHDQFLSLTANEQHRVFLPFTASTPSELF